MRKSMALLALSVGVSLLPMSAFADAEKPANLIADGIPAVPDAMVAATRPYMEFRTAGFRGWNPVDKSMLISTRFGNVAQLHVVKMPMGARTQISFEAEPVGGSWSPQGDVLLVSKDTGGSEFFQLYTLKDGKLTLLTDGKSRNGFQGFSKDGELIAYSSTRRNGTDNDLYVMNPRAPKTDRMVAEVKGGGWGFADFAPDKKTAVIAEYVSVTKSNLYLLDLATGQKTPIGDHKKDIAYGGATFAPDGTLWVTSDEGSDFQRLGTLDIKTGKFTPKSPEPKWDVDSFDISDDGSMIAYSVNEAGVTRLRLLDPKTGKSTPVTGLPDGTIGGFDFAPWGEIGLTLASAKAASDAYSVDPKTMTVKRWTQSETGGLDPNVNAEPQFVEVTSFDKEKVSGFLYRPDPKKFPGKRPLIVNIHGGPEGQSTTGFLGRTNYLVNELGIAVFYPNVRGSTGFGKRFVSLDNGPFLRENSVKDIGAFLDVLDKDAGVDASKIAVTGGSYGGYMCYAVAIRYGARLKGANCVVAISNFVTFLENTQSYRRDLRRVEYGDERDPKQKAKLLEISPMTSVAKLNIPLMVVTGANDPRVPQSEADQMVAAVRAKGGMAWHLVGKDEGHGFAKKANQDYQFWASLIFWEKTLLGE
ncbi:prolyl oligopeptidase family serine peptidase [Asticcacaulis sp. BYS171W]|uniref:Prolyl oligopeptidase family serine peptidase n=1 Tax=Asticcacaulis aquaticus TaxID=2984212 RepID=A0ABT5HXA9_9CAUL|nr:prolyl oligopeptidase family serine peptidase [Asticcacaulis aquaticus]MDC7684679.1 prolyl oligopeptidase family serine peptidase [Asticcacaulis aquaticus]